MPEKSIEGLHLPHGLLAKLATAALQVRGDSSSSRCVEFIAVKSKEIRTDLVARVQDA